MIMNNHNNTKTNLELLALKNVPVGTARLARTRRDSSIQTTGAELRLEQVVDLSVLLALGEDARGVVGQLLLFGRGLGLLAPSCYGLRVLYREYLS
jgi:hypothetical protein